jgi:rhodanese-related sulfurtransferase
MRFTLFFSFLIAIVLVIMAGCTTSGSQESPAEQPSDKLTENNAPLPEAGNSKSGTVSGESAQRTGGELTAKELASKLTSGEKLVLIDVNPITEYKEGHIKDAIWGDFKSMRTSTPETYLSQLGIKKTDTIVLICEMGGKSANTVPFLVKAGYQEVYNLEEGNIGWIRAGFDLIRE